MNSYPGYRGFEELDRRSRMDGYMGLGGLGLGDVVGSMITTTLFGLTRTMDEVSPETRRPAHRQSANDDLILEASGWR